MFIKKSLLSLALLAVFSSAQAVTVSKTFAVSNTGNGSLTLSNKRITGTAAAAYSLTGDTCASPLSAGGACDLTVSFTPTATGSFPAALEFDTDGTTGPQVIPLSGSGQVASLASQVSAVKGSIMGPCGSMSPMYIEEIRVDSTGSPFVVNSIVAAANGWALLNVMISSGSTSVVANPLPSSVSTTGYTWAGSTVDSTYRLSIRYSGCTIPALPSSLTFTTTTGITQTWSGTWTSGAGTANWTKQ